jgi:hypothetical protein
VSTSEVCGANLHRMMLRWCRDGELGAVCVKAPFPDPPRKQGPLALHHAPVVPTSGTPVCRVRGQGTHLVVHCSEVRRALLQRRAPLHQHTQLRCQTLVAARLQCGLKRLVEQ